MTRKIEETIRVAESVYILMGSNLGNRSEQLRHAEKKIGELKGLNIISVSSVYESAAHEMKEEQPAFLNQVIKIDYRLIPLELLHQLETIELSLGRDNKGELRARTIDLDILYFGRQIISSDRLSIPHPRILKRDFAILPMLELEPKFIEPISLKPLSDFLPHITSNEIKIVEQPVTQNV